MTRKPDLEWWPRPPELDAAPELAVLATLRASVQILTSALLSAHPHLAGDFDWSQPHDDDVRAAYRVFVRADHLRKAIDHYRDIIAIARLIPDHDDFGPIADDIPF